LPATWLAMRSATAAVAASTARRVSTSKDSLFKGPHPPAVPEALDYTTPVPATSPRHPSNAPR
jgi:hypothetical protein